MAATAFGGLDVQRAVAHVNGEIAHAVIGLAADDQAALDERLIALDGTPNKPRLGANATLAVSMAAAHAAAAARGLPLYRHLAGEGEVLLPMPQVQIFGGGAHAGRRVDIQDFMVVCPGASSFAQALEWTAEVYRHAGAADALARRAGRRGRRGRLVAGLRQQRTGARDAARRHRGAPASCRARRWRWRSTSRPATSAAAAATRLGLERRELDSDGLIELLLRWCERFPIASIEDPLAEDDPIAFARFTRAVGDRLQVVGDDFLVSDAALLREAAAAGAANTVLLKPNQRGTLTETLRCREAARELRLRHHRLGAFRRDRGHQHRRPRHRLARRPAQGRLVRAQRAHGQVERGAAHRGAAGRAGALRRRGRVRTQRDGALSGRVRSSSSS